MSPSDDDPPGWLDALEPDQVAGFRAFRRTQTEADHGLQDDPQAVSALPPNVNPNLARRVYAGVEGAIDLVPSPNTICCVVTVAGTGESMSGSTTTELASRGAHGFTSSGRERSATFRGVLGAAVRDLRIVTAASAVVTVPVNDDDAYWITIVDPLNAILTLTRNRARYPIFHRPVDHNAEDNRKAGPRSPLAKSPATWPVFRESSRLALAVLTLRARVRDPLSTARAVGSAQMLPLRMAQRVSSGS